MIVGRHKAGPYATKVKTKPANRNVIARDGDVAGNALADGPSLV
jgi:hypothetical protein